MCTVEGAGSSFLELDARVTNCRFGSEARAKDRESWASSELATSDRFPLLSGKSVCSAPLLHSDCALLFSRFPVTIPSHLYNDWEDLVVSSRLAMLTPATATHTTTTSQNKRSVKAPAQSLNHLLNFTLPPRQIHYNQSIPRRARKTGNQYGVWNKEREYTHITPQSSGKMPDIPQALSTLSTGS